MKVSWIIFVLGVAQVAVSLRFPLLSSRLFQRSLSVGCAGTEPLQSSEYAVRLQSEVSDPSELVGTLVWKEYGNDDRFDELANEFFKRYEHFHKKPFNGLLSRYLYNNRQDLILVKLMEETHCTNFKNSSGISIDYVHEKYKDFVEIDDYDGLESMSINLEKFRIKGALDIYESNATSDSDILEKIHDVLTKKFEAYVFHDKKPTREELQHIPIWY